MSQVDKKQPTLNKFSIVDWLWRIFSSMRLAVILILVIAGLCLLGVLLIQVPPEMAGDPQLYTYWVDSVARNKVGGLAPILSALSFFNVFHSPWFLIAGVLLILNIFICSVNRWRVISLSLSGGTIKHTESYYSTGNSCTELSNLLTPVPQTVDISEKVLKAQGYRTRTEIEQDNIYIAADKNRYHRLGTYFSHLSLIIFILAFITGNYFGFHDTGFTVPVGGNREVGHNTGLSLELTSFADEYYDNGMPKDYRSQVVLYENGHSVKEALIRVNYPLIYKGIRFYQAYFGPAVKILVRDENGLEIFNGTVPLDSSFNVEGYNYYEGFFYLPEPGLSARLISPPINADSPIIPEGQLAVDLRQGEEQIDLKLVELSTPRIVGGLEFTFLENSKYSGFQVSRDPTNILIWIASILFILGVCTVLYFPYYQVWILSKPGNKGTSRLLVRSSSNRSTSSTSTLDNIVSQIEKEIGFSGNMRENKEK